MFAKLYETEVGQVLVKLDASADDDGWDKAEAAFEQIDEANAVHIARDTIKSMGLSA